MGLIKVSNATSDELKLTLTSAEMKSQWDEYPSSNLIDGDKTNFAHSYEQSDGMWIRVTLASYSAITRIVITNR